jgi:hypothetical protein
MPASEGEIPEILWSVFILAGFDGDIVKFMGKLPCTTSSVPDPVWKWFDSGVTTHVIKTWQPGSVTRGGLR